MMKKQIIYMALLGSIFSGKINAQNTVELQLTPLYDGQTLQLNSVYTDPAGYDFKVTRLQYYIGNIAVTHDGAQTTTLNTTDDYILANANSVIFESGSGNISSVESIGFNVGVDASVNHNDPSLYANGHPLANQSPTMHWGWSAGYRFLALELEVDVDGDGTMETLMQSHVVDDAFLTAVTPITISNSVVEGGNVKIALNYDLKNWLTSVDISTAGLNHGGGTVNTQLMNNINPENVFSEGTVTNIHQNNAIEAEVTVVENQISFNSDELITQYTLTDISGKIVKTGSPNQSNGQIIYNLSAGIYVITLKNAQGQSFIQKLKL